MKIKLLISYLVVFTAFVPIKGITQTNVPITEFEFLGTSIRIPYNHQYFVDFKGPLSQTDIQAFNNSISRKDFQPLLNALQEYKKQFKLDDWLFYQLVRRTAQQISPKAENYQRYTLYKWWLLTNSGYDAILTISGERILFYIRCDENIYNIPSHISKGKQYVCLNYHDYGTIDFAQTNFTEVSLDVPGAEKTFSYKIRKMPELNVNDYQEKNLQFTYYDNQYSFKIKLNPGIKTLFNNYPVVDYESYFNIPLSDATYSSLIPVLKENISKMSVKNGVDYLMRFTRDAFSYVPDSESFGKEKRLSPEQTLMYDQSDCDDRAALFFYLVKEIYNLPMLALAFPNHVTVAVKFDKPVGRPIMYNGVEYSLCEPTPQKQDLRVGQWLPDLKHQTYEVAYVYNPQQK